jgi:enamine deaminase RidA (YjgF/YER057c/UK114 family)
MAEIEILNPDSVAAPGGTYSHVARLRGDATLIVVAGQVALDRDRNVIGIDDFERQCDAVFENLGAALRGAGGDWRSVIQLMTFLTRKEDIARLRAWRQRQFPGMFPNDAYPPNTLLVVSALASDELLLEVQALAAV